MDTACRVPTRFTRLRWTRIRCRPGPARWVLRVANVGALAAIMNAVVDALSPFGVAHLDMPATPEKVWRAISTARRA